MSIDLQSERLYLRHADRVIRRRVSLWEPEPPKQKALMELYRQWEALRPADLIPARKDFDILKLRAVMGMTCVIDVGPQDPMDFLVRLYGSQIPLPDNMSGRRLAEMHTSQVYREMLAQDYSAARDIGVPIYHDVVASIDYITHSYARLILPFAADGRTVDQLIVCSVITKFPDLLAKLR